MKLSTPSRPGSRRKSLVGLGLATYAIYLVACGSDSPDQARSKQQLVLGAEHARIFGFEHTEADWTNTTAATDRTQGSFAARVDKDAQAVIVQASGVSPLGPHGTHATFDIKIPSTQNSPGVRLRLISGGFECDEYWPLHEKTIGEFHSLSMNLQNCGSILDGTYGDLTVQFDISGPDGDYLLDKLEFGGEATLPADGQGGASGTGGNASGGMTGSGGETSAGGNQQSGGGGTGGGGEEPYVPPAVCNTNPEGTQYLSIKVPKGTEFEDVAIGAQGGVLKLNDGVEILDEFGFGRLTAISGVAGSTELGRSAVSGQIISDRDVFLRNYATVHGGVVTSGAYSDQEGAATQPPGLVVENRELTPYSIETVPYKFPITTQSVGVVNEAVRTLVPGAYDSVVLQSQNTLELSSGKYYFDGLRLESGTTLRVNNSSGPVLVFIKGDFTFRGVFDYEESDRSNTMFAVTDGGVVAINNTSFHGVLIAPHSDLVLPSSSEGHTGAFFARSIEVHQHTTVEHRPFARLDCGDADGTGSEFGCRPRDLDRDGLSDCEEENDGYHWTDPKIFNGVSARRSGACLNSLDSESIDDLSELEACLETTGRAEWSDQYSGWDWLFATQGDVCGPEYGFVPEWNFCANDTSIHADSLIDLDTGLQCFRILGDSSSSSAVLFFADETQGITYDSGTSCFDVSEGAYRLRWFLDAPNGSVNSFSVQHCSGEGCTPGAISNRSLRRFHCENQVLDGDEEEVDCGGACGECRCGNGVLDPDEVCDTGIRTDCRSDCAAIIDPDCATLGACTSTPPPVGVPPGSCAAGCAEGLTCGYGNGHRFGYDSSVDMCWPTDYGSLDPSINPCLDPANGGLDLGYGFCPVCQPQCDGRTCGDDGCGGTCGTCPTGEFCDGGSCHWQAVLSAGYPGEPVPRAGFEFPETNVFEGTTPGAIEAEFAVNDQGEATYRIPLVVPPGRAGFQPDLALTYNSSRGNGFLGHGWALEGLSTISRCNQTIPSDGVSRAPGYGDKDAYCLNGRRLIVVGSGTEDGNFYRLYRTEVEQFSRVKGYVSEGAIGLYPDWFEVDTKDGRHMEFGRTPDSRIEAGPGRLQGVQAWAVNKIVDRARNSIRIRYTKHLNELGTVTREYYPESIIYGWHDADASATAHAAVHFDYGPRPDTLSGYKNGVEFQVNHLLTQIRMQLGSNSFRAYRIAYVQPGGESARSTISEITECAKPLGSPDFTSAPCKAPIRFQYSHGVGVTTYSMPGISGGAGFFGGLPLFHNPGVRLLNDKGPVVRHVLDLNGDGYDDFLVPVKTIDGYSLRNDCITPLEDAPTGSTQGPHPYCSSYWQVVLSDGNGGYNTFNTGVPLAIRATLAQQEDAADARQVQSDLRPWAYVCMGDGVVADLDNDGDEELIETDCRSDGIEQSHYTVIDFDESWFDPTNPSNVPGHNSNLPYAEGPFRRVQLDRGTDGGEDGVLYRGIDSNVAATFSSSAADYNGATNLGHVYYMDADGDGYKDLLVCENSFEWTLYRYSGDTSDISMAFESGRRVEGLDEWCYADSVGPHATVDLDGDGRDELILREVFGHGETQQRVMHIEPLPDRVTINRVRQIDTNFPRLQTYLNDIAPPRWLDFNGDGLADQMATAQKGIVVSLNRGDGYFENLPAEPVEAYHDCDKGPEPDLSSSLLDIFDEPYGNDRVCDSGTHLADFWNGLQVDVDGDGRLDMVVYGKPNWTWFRSTGEEFVEFDLGIAPAFVNRPETLRPATADIDADGVDEIVMIHDLSGGWQVLDFNGPRVTEMVGVTDSLGARTEITYTHLKDVNAYERDGRHCQFPQKCIFKSSQRVVRAVDYWDEPDNGAAAARSEVHRYKNSGFHPARRTWLGFGEHVTEHYATFEFTQEPVGHRQVLMDNRTYFPEIEVFPFSHRPEFVLETTPVPDFKAIRTITTVHNEVVFDLGLANGNGDLRTAHVFQGSKRTRTEEFSGASFDNIRVEEEEVQSIDQFGNALVTTMSVSGDDGNADQYQTVISYDLSQPRIDAWQIDLVERTSVHHEVSGLPAGDEMAAKTRSNEYQYFANGLLKGSVREPGTGVGKRFANYTRDQYGNVTSFEDLVNPGSIVEESRVTHLDYDSVGFAPIMVTNAEGHAATVLVDARFGEVTRVTDPNGLIVDTWHDDFGRPRTEIRPDNTTTIWEYHFGDTEDVSMRTTQRVDGGELSNIHYDILGRPARTERTGLGGLIVQARRYNSLGFVESIDRPHKADAFNPRGTEIESDFLGRPLEIEHPNGGVTRYCYDDRVTCEITSASVNGLEASRCRIIDRNGRVVMSAEWPRIIEGEGVVDCDLAVFLARQVENGSASNDVAAVYYHYGAFGDVRHIDKVEGGIIEVTTDVIGRVNWIDDPDLGVLQRTYTGFDEVRNANDGAGNQIRHFYDKLGRLIRRQENAGREVLWHYDGEGIDAQGELIGSLTGASIPDDDFSETYHYDTSNGRIIGVDRQMGAETFSTAYQYLANGLLDQVTLPQADTQDAISLKYDYDSRGHLLGVKDPNHERGVEGYYWRLTDVDPTDDYEQLKSEKVGAVQTTRNYSTGGRVSTILTALLDGPNVVHTAQFLTYSFDLVNNIRSRTDLRRQIKEVFRYDSMDRLVCAEVTEFGTTHCSEDTYEYDELGRFVTKDGRTYSYDGSVKHGPSSVVDPLGFGDHFEYFNGNRIRETNPSFVKRYAYNPLRQLRETWREGSDPSEQLNLVTFEYGVNDDRVKKTTQESETIYFGDYERRKATDGSSVEHVYKVNNGRRQIAQISLEEISGSDTTVYLHDDALGSIQAVTDADGNVVDEFSHDAFGRRRSPIDWTGGPPPPASNVTAGFTGHEFDRELRLINMKGREFDPRIGVFLQADPIVQDPLVPRSFNRFSYVWNNPLRFVDPTGFQTAQSNADGSVTGADGTRALYDNSEPRIDDGDGSHYFFGADRIFPNADQNSSVQNEDGEATVATTPAIDTTEQSLAPDGPPGDDARASGFGGVPNSPAEDARRVVEVEQMVYFARCEASGALCDGYVVYSEQSTDSRHGGEEGQGSVSIPRAEIEPIGEVDANYRESGVSGPGGVAARGTARAAARLLNGRTTFSSFRELKRVLGDAGPGQAWHHIVEQTPANINRFGAEAIHNVHNVIRLPHGKGTIHAKISGYYSSKQPFTKGLTVRRWLRTQSYEKQMKFGINTLKRLGVKL